jgi:uncharacterized protein
MLLVNAKAGPSPIHRIGLIAQAFIPKGTKIWDFMPGFDVLIREVDMERLPPHTQEQVIYWAYFHLATRTFVLSSDDDRFTNHSDAPNTGGLDYTVALQDIQAGEEITNNYNDLGLLNFSDTND